MINIHTSGLTSREDIIWGKSPRYLTVFQGCIHRCKNCTTKDLWTIVGSRLVSIRDVAIDIVDSGAVTLLITGGEPFLQVEELHRLVLAVKDIKPDIQIWVFTAYTYNRIVTMTRKSADYYGVIENIDMLATRPCPFREGSHLHGPKAAYAYYRVAHIATGWTLEQVNNPTLK